MGRTLDRHSHNSWTRLRVQVCPSLPARLGPSWPQLEAHINWVRAIASTSQAHCTTLILWNLDNGQPIGLPLQHANLVHSVAFSEDGKLLATGCRDRNTYTWDAATITPHQKFEGHTKRVTGAIHLPGGQQIITCSYDGSLRVWNLKSGKQIGEDWRDGGGHVYCIALSPDGKKVVSGSEDGAVRLWDIDTGKAIAKWIGHTERVLSEVSCLAWTKDGKTLISGSNDHLIRTWNIKKWKKTAVLKAHTLFVFAIAISPNDRILASASHDNTVLLWNLDNGRPIGPPLQHADMVDSVSFSEDGKLLATGCADRNAYTWDVVAIVTEAGLDDLLLDSKAS
ncbi:WD40-repeat-containing domain protein [Suillus tomentosus]|nr:WD40-repeat-containing domain protein [Suillus tomentosus]